MGCCTGAPPDAPPPPRQVWQAVVPVERPPAKPQVYKTQAAAYIRERYRQYITSWECPANGDLYAGLCGLMNNPPEAAYFAVAMGHQEANALNFIKNNPVDRDLLDARFPLTDETPATLRMLATDSQGKFKCHFVAYWLRKFLSAVKAEQQQLTDINRHLGNHSFVRVPYDNDCVVVDGTWRQYKGDLGIELPTADLPMILVAKRRELGTLLKTRFQAKNTSKARSLVKFWGGIADQLG
jgi:hypothetical protein